MDRATTAGSTNSQFDLITRIPLGVGATRSGGNVVLYAPTPPPLMVKADMYCIMIGARSSCTAADLPRKP
jgi:hypothetical protein